MIETRTTDPAVATGPVPPVRADRTYTIFMLVRTTEAWLGLAPEQRFAFLRTDIEPLLKRHRAVALRFFDTEFFNSDVTDVLMWETADLAAYQSLIEGLRDTRFWDQYFKVVSILPGVENAYAAHYEVEAMGQ